jgi:sugar lactone lactonase YvrE
MVNTTTGAATVIAENIGRPRGIAVLPEPDGRIVLSDYLHHTVRLLDPDTGTITDLAGALDTSGFVDGNGAAARFFGPYGVAVLPDGRIAVADLFNHRIRAVELDGDVTTLAGTGVAGFDNGAADGATFRYPQDLAVDAAGNLYIADLDNFVVRRLAAGQVTTVVGSGTAGASDNDDLLAAQLYGLEGLDVSPDGATLWIADGSRGEDVPYHRVRIVDLDGP